MMHRRSEKIMMDLILKVAQENELIRAIVMNGSRASPSAKKDIFQDYDIVYIVDDVETFVIDNEWVKLFGEILIMQKPDEMDNNWEKDKNSYSYLMQFKDWNRIDLTLLHKSKVPGWHRDSQSILLLDKDNLLGKFDPPSDRDYLPKPPTEKEFVDCCNEFLWVSTYVAKGICRRELTYAKYVSEKVVKTELIKLLVWYAGIKTHFEVTMGYCGKYLEKYIEKEIWEKFKKTYVDANYDHMWDGLFEMCDIFHNVSAMISKHYGYLYDEREHKEVVEYLKEVRNRKSN